MAAKVAASGSRGLAAMALGWGVFTGSHLVMSHPPNREALIQALGDEKKFLGVYSAVAAASFFPTTFVYLRYARGAGRIPGWTNLTQQSLAVRGLGLGVKAAAAVTFGQAISTKNDADILERKEEVREGITPSSTCEPRGIFRITRHPLFSALAMLGLGNILLRGFAGDVVYWGGYILIWATGCPHQDYRLSTSKLLPQSYYNQTSFLPFGAIIAGKQSLKEAFSEFNKPVLVASLVAPIFFL